MLLLFVSVVGMLFAMDWVLTLMILIPLPLAVLIFYAFRRRMNRMYHKQWASESAVNTLLHDVFRGSAWSRCSAAEKREEERFARAANRVADISKKNETTWNLLMPFANFLMGIGEYAVLLFVGREGHRGRGDARRAEPVPYLRRYAVRPGPLGGVHSPPADRAMTSMAKIFELLDESRISAISLPRARRTSAATSSLTMSASAITIMNTSSKTSICVSEAAR